MHSIPIESIADSRLRIVYGGHVISTGIAATATLGEIAATLRRLDARRYGDPLAIDVTVAAGRSRPDGGGAQAIAF
jgi:hypothetical protein